ncbi:hypothetical protein [Candidatus Entotheonella palauensis]|uniref:Uncharacterized protein n=1 Tax=Candidatus Entotheonella gemina TaxID=1429439 RepID=W4LY65_9BACT|nr:hypothetical protein [Candidatus Entotheonella palauensis]ETX02292.1 MAG: hypothetical protein ETSY2_35780 [Candidatus Entotheonella gemina]
MSRELSTPDETLAKAAILFCQKTHRTFPGTVVEAVDGHYSDEDLTVEIQVPPELDQQHVSDELIRIALAVEDQYGVTIVTHTIMAKPTEA